MSHEVPQELLRPSLSHNAPRLAPYSQQTGFLTAFLGGPPAALLIAGVNAQRMGRLAKDLPWLLALGIVYVAAEYTLFQTELGHDAANWIRTVANWRVYHQLLSLLFFGVASLAHRREQRAATLMGADRPKGLWMGVLLIALGYVLTNVVYEVFS